MSETMMKKRENIMKRVSKKTSGGYGMLELVISGFVITVIVSGAATMFVFFIRNYNFSFEEGRILSDAETVVRKMTTEIREARTSEEGAYPLVAANDQEVQFYSDVDNDDEVEKVRYFLDGQDLMRGVVEPQASTPIYDDMTEMTKVVSSFVTNDSEPLFYYYNGDWPGDAVNNPLVQADRLLDTRLIQVEIKINTGEGFGVEDFELATEVMMRNLKTN